VIVGGDEALLAAAAAATVRAGFETELRKGATLADSLGELAHDLVVTVVEEPADAMEQVAIALGAARAAHPDLPLVIFADGSSAWAACLLLHVDAGSVCVIEPTVDLSKGLAALSDWERLRTLVAREPARPRDAGRLRRALRELEGQSAGLYSPTVQADLVAALGLPHARAVRVPYLEDCLIASAELGYPLRLAAIHADMSFADAPAWVLVRAVDELMEHAERELLTMNRAIGRRAELVLSESLAGQGWPLSILATRHEDFGVVVTVSHNRDSASFVPPGPADLALELERLGLPTQHASVVTAAEDGISAVVGAVLEVEKLQALSVLLDIGPAGFTIRHSAVLSETTA
jgi:hypothetical protein